MKVNALMDGTSTGTVEMYLSLNEKRVAKSDECVASKRFGEKIGHLFCSVMLLGEFCPTKIVICYGPKPSYIPIKL